MPDINATKKLSQVIGKEEFFKLNKCSIKFMKTGKTYSSQGSSYRLFTIKPIKENGCNEEMQFHVRLAVNDFGEDAGLLDVDFYINKSDFDTVFKKVNDLQ
jgi:hypothetical protein